jgi:hypothetical protein
VDRTIHIGALILLLCCSTAVHAVQPETGGSEARTEPEVPDAAAVSEDVADSIAMVEGDVREIEEHPQDAPADVGFLIVTADGRSRLRIRGSIRVNGGYDINGLLGSNTFTPIDIPVGREQDGETAFFMRANQSRLGIDISQQTPIGDGFGRLELDFLGSGATARVRHAFGGMGPVLVGQTWSTFSDVNSLPLTVDLDGPSSSVAERTVQIRYTREIDESFVMAVGVESPKLEVDEPDTLTLRPAFQTFPDVAAWTRHRAGWGHLQISGVLRSISVRNAAGNLDVLAGYGGLFSGRVGLAGEDALLFQAVLGSGISKFITAFAGRNLDVIFNPISGEFETLGVGGGYASYDRVWTETLHSYFTAGLISIFNKIYEEDSAFNHAEYVSANLFWDPGHGGRVGLEYTFGRRVNKDQQDGIANRIAFIFYYDF